MSLGLNSPHPSKAPLIFINGNISLAKKNFFSRRLKLEERTKKELDTEEEIPPELEVAPRYNLLALLKLFILLSAPKVLLEDL